MWGDHIMSKEELELEKSRDRAREAKGALLYRALVSVAENDYERSMAKELAAEIYRKITSW